MERPSRDQAGNSPPISLSLDPPVMLMQPFSLDVYSYSFIVLLAGVVGFSIAGKLPS